MVNFIFAQNGYIKLVAGNGVRGFGGDGAQAINAQINAYDVLADTEGNIYFSDDVFSVVRKVNLASGIITTIAGTGNPGYNGDNILAVNATLTTPRGLAFGNDGDLYLADFNNNRIRKVNLKTGIITTVAGTGLTLYNGDGLLATNTNIYGPRGLAVDKNGDIYICEELNNRIRKVNHLDGTISTVAGGGTIKEDGYLASQVELKAPLDVCIDGFGNFYINEGGRNRVRKVSKSDGIIRAFAGNGYYGFSGDGGIALDARFNNPGTIDVDSIGNLFIGDYNNNKLRKVTANDNIINSIAGTGIGSLPLGPDPIPAMDAVLFPFGVDITMSGDVYITSTRYQIVKLYGGTLPISLSSFDVSQKQSSVSVEWTTLSEINNDYFIVERSPLPNIGFQEISLIKSKGNFTGVQYYTYTDINPPSGKSYYRLKQVDKDGGYYYSKIIEIEFSNNNSIYIYPNPVKDVLTIEGLSTEFQNKLSIISQNGTKVAQTSTNMGTLNWNVKQLSAGTYFILIENDKFKRIEKLIKL
ncbi:MAG TPA: T9SS type A sorting domain-containing protein [Panacibacter sp.]|nr:T9SS type A sorting domain-containing protein [Panacibacter sp.]